MMSKPGILILFMMVFLAGCKTTAPVSSNASGAMILEIQTYGNTYDKVMELINRQTCLREVRIVDADICFGYSQQIEIEIGFLNTKQMSLLQTEIFRIPGVISVNFL